MTKHQTPQLVRDHDEQVSAEYVECRDPFVMRDTRALQLALARAQARVRVLTCREREGLST